MNPYEHSVVIRKGWGFQYKKQVKSFANFVGGKVKTMTLKALPKTPENTSDKARHLNKATALIS